MTITTKFNLFDTVKIKELNRIGKILSFYYSEVGGPQYNIRYLDGAEYKVCYFFEDELDENTNTEVLGFKG